MPVQIQTRAILGQIIRLTAYFLTFKKATYSIFKVLCFCLFFSNLYAQQITIKGKVVDSLKTESNHLEFATVQLTNINTQKTNSTLTDEKGTFSIKGIEKGKYLLKVKYLGYNEKNISFQLSRDTISILVALKPSSQLLDEIKVKGEKALIEVKPDRLVYNINQEKEQGNSLYEIIRKAPFVSVVNDEIRVKNSSNIKILVDGRETTLSFNELKNLMGTQLKSIEIITFPSAKFDGDVDNVINIIKKPLPSYFLGGVSYLGISNRLSNLGGTINYQKDKLYLSSTIGISYERLLGGANNSRNNTDENDRYLLNQIDEFKNKNLSFNYSFALDKEFSKNRAFSAGLNVTFDDGNVQNDIRTSLQKNEDSQNINMLSYFNKNKSKSTSVGLNLSYAKTYKPRKNFNISTLLKYNPSNTNLNSTANPTGINFINNNENTQSEITSAIDYTNYSNALKGFETGTKFIYRDFDGKSSYNSAPLSQTIDYQQFISASYISLLKKLNKRTTFRMGVRGEYTYNSAPNFTNTDFSLLPNILLSIQESGTQSTTLVYSKRIQRPGILFLNPFIDQSDPNNLRIGNPTLKPEFFHNITLSHNSIGKILRFSPSIYFRKGTDLIAGLRTLDQATATIQFKNIATSDVIGSDLFLGISASNNLYISISSGLKSHKITSSEQSREAFIYNLNTNFSWQLSQKESIEGYINYQSGRVFLQGKEGNSYFMNLSYRYSFNEKSSLKLTIDNPIINKVNTPIFLDGDSFSSSGNRYFYGRAIQLRYIRSFGKNIQTKKLTKDVKNVDVKTEE